MVDFYAVSNEKWEEAKLKKFYHSDYPILFEKISSLVKKYKKGGCLSDFKKEFRSNKEYQFKRLQKEPEDVIYFATTFNGKDLSTEKTFKCSKSKNQCKLQAIAKSINKFQLLIDKDEVRWQDWFEIPIVFAFQSSLEPKQIDFEFWENERYYKPFGLDEEVLAHEFCHAENGWEFEETDEVMVCPDQLNKLKLVSVTVYDPFDLVQSQIPLKKTENYMKLFYKLTISKFEDLIDHIKYEDTFDLKQQIEELFKEKFFGEIEYENSWMEHDMLNILNEYLKEDFFQEWEIKLKPSELLSEVVTKYQVDASFFKIYQRETDENKIKMLRDKFETKRMEQELMRKKVGQQIATNMKEYCYLEIMKNIRPFVYETIHSIQDKIKDFAYIAIAGGEPMNQMLDFKDRATTTDVDTKIFLKLQPTKCKDYVSIYKDECVRFTNYFWYHLYPKVQEELEQRYKDDIYPKLVDVGKILEMRLFGFSAFHPEFDNDVVFKRRYTRLSRQQEVILFTIDMKLKQSIIFQDEFILGNNVYSGFLDSPLIYNPYEAEHLYDHIIRAKPLDFLVVEKSQDHANFSTWKKELKKRDIDTSGLRYLEIPAIYKNDFYYISPIYAIHDTERLVRTKERPEKIEKDKARFKQLMEKFGKFDQYKEMSVPKVKELTNIPFNEYNPDHFPEEEEIEIDHKCKNLVPSLDEDIHIYSTDENQNKIAKILFFTVSYEMVKPHLDELIDELEEDQVYPFFLQSRGREKIKDWIKHFYFKPEKQFELSHRNINTFKIKDEKYLCASNDDERCFDKCDKNQNGCNVFGYKSKYRLTNMSIGKKSKFYQFYWIPFLIKALNYHLHEVLKSNNKKKLLDLLPDFTTKTTLTEKEIILYYSILFTGIRNYTWNEYADQTIYLLEKIQKKFDVSIEYD